MDEKTWNSLSTDEKLKRLRDDNARLRDEVGRAHRRLDQHERGLDEAYGRLAALEKKLNPPASDEQS